MKERPVDSADAKRGVKGEIEVRIGSGKNGNEAIPRGQKWMGS